MSEFAKNKPFVFIIYPAVLIVMMSGCTDTGKLPPEGTYEPVPEGELTMAELARAKSTPEVVDMCTKITMEECKRTSAAELRDGAYHVFRYNTSDGERFCKLEVHRLSAVARGNPMREHCGCSTFRRK